MLVAAIVVAGGNVMRAASWSQVDGFVWGPFAPHDRPARATTVSGLDTLEIAIPAWRPLRLVFSARAIDQSRPRGPVTLDPPAGRVQRAAPETLVDTVRAGEGWRAPRHRLDESARHRPGRPALTRSNRSFERYAGVPRGGWGSRGGVARLPVPGAVERTAPQVDRSRRRRRAPSPRPWRSGAVAGCSACGHRQASVQGPDEVQHHLRATLMPVTRVSAARRRRRPRWPYRHPLVEPNPLHAIIGDPRPPHGRSDRRPETEPWWPASRYATTGSVPAWCRSPRSTTGPCSDSAGRQAHLGLGPYASVIATPASICSRCAVASSSSCCDESPRPRRMPAILGVVLNPMLAAMSSIVNPDAV